jgi:hypothetical protein
LPLHNSPSFAIARGAPTTDTASTDLTKTYHVAKSAVIAAGYQSELDWQAAVSLETLTEPDFLQYTAFVILVSGFRSAVVNRIFPAISTAFLDWSSAASLTENATTCLADASRIFRNQTKLTAIVHLCRHVADTGFPAVHKAIRTQGIAYLRILPFIGPVTVFHLAKNGLSGLICRNGL